MAADEPEKTSTAALAALLPCRCSRCADALQSVPKVCIALESLPESVVRRFLRGCKGDTDKAAHVLTTSYLWRDAFGVDALREDPDGSAAARAQVMQRLYPSVLYDRPDRDGRVVWIERTGLCDPTFSWSTDNFFGDETGPEAWLRCHVRLNEKAGEAHEQRVVVMDMYNAGKHHLCKAGLDLIKGMIQVDQRNYPETLHRLYIVNTPWLLHASYSMVSRWMDPVTASKIQVLGPVEDEAVHAALLETIALDDLPRFLGGARNGADVVARCAVHYTLRAGELPLDGEREASLSAGAESAVAAPVTAATAAAAAAAAAAQPAIADAVHTHGSLQLIVRSHGGGAKLRARWVRRRAGGEAGGDKALGEALSVVEVEAEPRLITLELPPQLVALNGGGGDGDGGGDGGGVGEGNDGDGEAGDEAAVREAGQALDGLRLGEEGEGAGVELQLSFVSENYYRACKVFWEVTGVDRSTWR